LRFLHCIAFNTCPACATYLIFSPSEVIEVGAERLLPLSLLFPACTLEKVSPSTTRENSSVVAGNAGHRCAFLPLKASEPVLLPCLTRHYELLPQRLFPAGAFALAAAAAAAAAPMAVAAATQADLLSRTRGRLATWDAHRVGLATSASGRFLPPHQARLASSRHGRSPLRIWRVSCDESAFDSTQKQSFFRILRSTRAEGLRDAELDAQSPRALRRSCFAARSPTGGLPAAAGARAAYSGAGDGGRSSEALRPYAVAGGDNNEDARRNTAKRRVQGPWRQHSSFWLRSVDNSNNPSFHSLSLHSPSPSSSFPSSSSSSYSSPPDHSSRRATFRASAFPPSSSPGRLSASASPARSASSSSASASSAVPAGSAGSVSLEADTLLGTGSAQEVALADRAIARADAAAAAAAAGAAGSGALTVTGGRRGGGRRDLNDPTSFAAAAAASAASDSQQLARTLHTPSAPSSRVRKSPGSPLSPPTSSRALPLHRRPFLFPLRLLRLRFRLARRALRALTLRQALRALLLVSYWLRWPLIALALVLGATWQMRHPGVRAARPVAYSDMVAAVKAGRVKNAALEESSNRIWFNVYSKGAAGADVGSAAAAAAAAGVAAAPSAAAVGDASVSCAITTSAEVSDQQADTLEAETAAETPLAVTAAPAAAEAEADVSSGAAITNTDTLAAATTPQTAALASSSSSPVSVSPIPPLPAHSSWRSFLISLGPPWSSLVRLPADPPFAYVSRRVHNDESFLLPLLINHSVRVASVPVPASQTLRTVFLTALTVWIPVAPLIYLMMKQLQGGKDGGWRRGQGKGGGKGKRGAGTGGRGSARQVAFEDVAGVDEAKRELMELVQGMKGAGAFAAMGAHIPKGVLLIGPPGTGKTLLARVVAAEADVPFFAASASEFVEMFVGRGAARVRELFREARKAAPAIVFIDEIDAVGARRGASSNDERDQTLNQLLTELDGFDTPDDGVLLLAATNRLDTLDPALTRSGRISRRVMVPLPDVEGRRDILRVHMRRMQERMKGRRRGGVEEEGGRADGESRGEVMRGGGGGGGGRLLGVWDVLGGAEEEDEGMRTVVARYTEGFSGADLENVVNEAAWLAARNGEARVSLDHLLDAVERTRNGIGTSTGALGMKPRSRGGVPNSNNSSSSSNPLLGLLSRALAPVLREERKDPPARAVSPGI
ncbi:hypothetical protein CLOP_g21161, partial [Closterium sp. NIES-67]